MTSPIALHSKAPPCWVALAYERYGLTAEALDYAEASLNEDIFEGGTPVRWIHWIGHTVKGKMTACHRVHVLAWEQREVKDGREKNVDKGSLLHPSMIKTNPVYAADA